MKFGTGVQHLYQISLLTFWEVRVIVQGQYRHAENFHYDYIDMFLNKIWHSDVWLPEVILAWNITPDNIQDGGLMQVCTLWLLASYRAYNNGSCYEFYAAGSFIKTLLQTYNFYDNIHHNMLIRSARVVKVLQDLFHVLWQM